MASPAGSARSPTGRTPSRTLDLCAVHASRAAMWASPSRPSELIQQLDHALPTAAPWLVVCSFVNPHDIACFRHAHAVHRDGAFEFTIDESLTRRAGRTRTCSGPSTMPRTARTSRRSPRPRRATGTPTHVWRSPIPDDWAAVPAALLPAAQERGRADGEGHDGAPRLAVQGRHHRRLHLRPRRDARRARRPCTRRCTRRTKRRRGCR